MDEVVTFEYEAKAERINSVMLTRKLQLICHKLISGEREKLRYPFLNY